MERPIQVYLQGRRDCLRSAPTWTKNFLSHVAKADKSTSPPITDDVTSTGLVSDNLGNMPAELVLALKVEPGFALTTSSEQHCFVEWQKTDLPGLQKSEVFQIVEQSSVPKGSRIYCTRIVDLAKKKKITAGP